MNLKEINRINELYHKTDKLQKRAITSKNYTYRTLVNVLDKYLKENAEILDLGCGVGTLDFYLASRGCNVTGVDDSSVAIKMARKNSKVLGVEKNTKYLQKNILKFETKDKFDAVLLFEVIEHLPDDTKVILNTKKVLKKNGLLFISTRSANAPLARIGLTKEHDRRVGHLRRYTLEKLSKIISDAAFMRIYCLKTEGLSKELLFSYPFGASIIRASNKFGFVSDLLYFVDKILMNLFGESQIIIVAKKK